MLRISDSELKQSARSNGYRPEILEKVYLLLDLLDEFMAVPYLSDRLVLKGGTAINLFCSDQFPRLSVDLDFNYIGAADRESMQKEKPDLENVLSDICKRRQYEFHRNPRSHAGGKTVLVYKSVMGTKGRLEIDQRRCAGEVRYRRWHNAADVAGRPMADSVRDDKPLFPSFNGIRNPALQRCSHRQSRSVCQRPLDAKLYCFSF